MGARQFDHLKHFRKGQALIPAKCIEPPSLLSTKANRIRNIKPLCSWTI
jgi:hypothetical protein